MDSLYSEDAEVTSADLEFGSLANSLALLLEAAQTELEHDHEAAKTSLATASCILQQEIERRSVAKGSRTGGLAGWQIARVRSFIDKNLHRTIRARDLSAVARRSTAHFSRSFKQAFGESPHTYVVRRRLEEACHLMLTSSAPLSEIALSVGFADQAHLSKLFRQVYGQSPANWRREHEAPGLADCYPRGAVAWRPRLEKECTVTGLHSDAQRQSRHFFQNDPPMASDLDPG